jgi:hypothetical protein
MQEDAMNAFLTVRGSHSHTQIVVYVLLLLLLFLFLIQKILNEHNVRLNIWFGLSCLGGYQVRETLALAAAFQLPPTVTLEERARLVDATIAELGLNKVADTLIGDAKVSEEESNARSFSTTNQHFCVYRAPFGVWLRV